VPGLRQAGHASSRLGASVLKGAGEAGLPRGTPTELTHCLEGLEGGSMVTAGVNPAWVSTGLLDGRILERSDRRRVFVKVFL